MIFIGKLDKNEIKSINETVFKKFNITTILNFLTTIFKLKNLGLGNNNHGDKPYKAVEYSKEFFSKVNRNWRSEYFGLTKRSEEPLPDELMELLSSNQRKTFSSIFSNKFDYGYEHDPRIEREDDVKAVKNLDLWRTSSPLSKPFKVLDVTDKNMKYRPKVTR